MAPLSMKSRLQRSARVGRLAVLDDACDMVDNHFAELVPVYALAAFPFALIGLLFLDAAAAGRTRELPALAAGLVASGWLRWLGGLSVQRRVALALGGRRPPPWRSLLRTYLWLRVFFFPACAGPAAMDPEAVHPVRRVLGVKAARRGFFSGLFLLTALFFGVAFLQLLALHYFFAHLLLPDVLGIDSQALRAIMFSRFWWLAIAMLLLLAFEFFQLVSGVLAYRALTDRSTGDDLYRRLYDADGGEA